MDARREWQWYLLIYLMAIVDASNKKAVPHLIFNLWKEVIDLNGQRMESDLKLESLTEDSHPQTHWNPFWSFDSKMWDSRRSSLEVQYQYEYYYRFKEIYNYEKHLPVGHKSLRVVHSVKVKKLISNFL
jgi:hypothetical protein